MNTKLKSTIAAKIYSILYFIDCKLNRIKDYSYENAPYCGHHFSGHKGYFTESNYHEGMGGCGAKVGKFWIFKNSEEKNWKMGYNYKRRKIGKWATITKVN